MEEYNFKAGNYCYRQKKGTFLHFKPTYVFAVEDETDPSSEHDYTPILLSKEWMEMLHFPTVRGKYNREGFTLSLDRKAGRYKHGDQEIKYIHQLQNMYKEDKGEELTV